MLLPSRVQFFSFLAGVIFTGAIFYGVYFLPRKDVDIAEYKHHINAIEAALQSDPELSKLLTDKFPYEKKKSEKLRVIQQKGYDAYAWDTDSPFRRILRFKMVIYVRDPQAKEVMLDLMEKIKKVLVAHNTGVKLLSVDMDTDVDEKTLSGDMFFQVPL